MNLNIINKKFYWTEHAQEKIRHYNLSESRLKRVFRHPHRVEEGVAENTIAAMQSAGSKKHPYEIWIMYQLRNEQVRVNSAWRYPGISPVGEKPPVPEDILNELNLKLN